MALTLLRVDISILRSDPGKLYKPINLFLVFALKILHWVNFWESDLRDWIDMGTEFLLKKKEKDKVRRWEEFCAVIDRSLFQWHCTQQTLISCGPYSGCRVMRLSAVAEAEIKKEMTASLLTGFFTSFILMSPLQTIFTDRTPFQLILLQADRPLRLILKAT